MKAEKLRRLEEETTPTARKVLAAVPVQSAWTPHQITGELQRNGIHMNFAVVMGCIKVLKESRLIRETSDGHYQRTVASDPPLVIVPDKPPLSITETHTRKPAMPDPAPTPAKSPTSLVERAEGLAKTLRHVADEIEALALDAETALKTKDETMKDLNDLSALIGKLATKGF